MGMGTGTGTGTGNPRIMKPGMGRCKESKLELSLAQEVKRIDKLERQMLDGKLMLVAHDDGKPLNNVVSLVNADSNSEVEEGVQ
ncbi:hypothetical protein Tco_1046996 [Tanacetum coccineum]